jgi:hypothetical protein
VSYRCYYKLKSKTSKEWTSHFCNYFLPLKLSFISCFRGWHVVLFIREQECRDRKASTFYWGFGSALPGLHSKSLLLWSYGITASIMLSSLSNVLMASGPVISKRHGVRTVTLNNSMALKPDWYYWLAHCASSESGKLVCIASLWEWITTRTRE